MQVSAVHAFKSLSVCVFVRKGSSDVEPPSKCCFAAGKGEAICNITIISDAIHELDEMFNIRLNPDLGQYICEPPEGPNTTITISEAQSKLVPLHNNYAKHCMQISELLLHETLLYIQVFSDIFN